jgi:hypothetical protein
MRRHEGKALLEALVDRIDQELAVLSAVGRRNQDPLRFP